MGAWTMNKLYVAFAVVALFSHNIFAGQKGSVVLHFNDQFGDIETYEIPDSTLSAAQNLLLLSSERIEEACYSGDPQIAMRRIDSLVTDGGTAVTMYERQVRGEQLVINISYRTNGKVKTQRLLLDSCQ